MRILSICQDDFANFMYDNMKALRSVGLDCDSVKMQRHPFYEEQAEVMSDYIHVNAIIRNYDVIQFFHDNLRLFDAIIPYCVGLKVIVYHTSSAYRRDHARINDGMNKWNVTHICAMPEFMAMCPGAIYMVGAVDTSRITPTSRDPGPVIFGHYPSNPKVKGTAKIVELMKGVNARFQYSDDGATIPHKNQLALMQECDVYIEMFTERDGLGSEYGNFGITSLEAGSLGLAVITNCRDLDVYQKHYGIEFFIPVITENGFMQVVRDLNNESVAKEAGRAARKLVVKNHSYKATGEYFIKNILKL